MRFFIESLRLHLMFLERELFSALADSSNTQYSYCHITKSGRILNVINSYEFIYFFYHLHFLDSSGLRNLVIVLRRLAGGRFGFFYGYWNPNSFRSCWHLSHSTMD